MDKDLSRLDPYPGTGPIPADAITLVRDPATGRDYRAPLSRLLGPSGGDTFPLNEPNSATPIGNLPAGSRLAGKTLLQLIRQAASQAYQAPAVTAFQLAGHGSRTVEVGTPFAGGMQTFTWTISNAANLEADSIQLAETTTNSLLATALANDGAETVAVTGFTAIEDETRRYRLVAMNSQRSQVTAEIIISGAYRLFFGPAASQPTSSAAVRALGSAPLLTEGTAFVLATGATQRIFCIAVPVGRRLVSVVDLDALSADITSQYVPTVFNVADAGGTPVAYSVYTMIQSIPYSSSHRHSFTIS